MAVILSLLAFLVWQMTKNWIISGAVELVVIAGTVIAYVAKSELFENLLPNILAKLELTDPMTVITDSSYLDISGIILYLSMIAVFLFLTIQMIQKRRWS